MKKLILGSILCALCAMIIVSCSKADGDELLEQIENQETENSGNETQVETRGPVADLSITGITSPLIVASGPCPGVAKADGTCNNGQPVNFNLQIRLTNNGTIGFAPGSTVQIAWVQFGRPRVVTTETLTNGLAPNSSVALTGPSWTLACPVGPPPYQLVTRQFYAVADPNNLIAEVDETNNFSTRYKVCDDI